MNEIKNKQVLVEIRDGLLQLRDHCVGELERQKEILEDKDGKIKNLLNIAEKMSLSEKIMNEEYRRRKQSVDYFSEKKKEIDELQKKFERI